MLTKDSTAASEATPSRRHQYCWRREAQPYIGACAARSGALVAENLPASGRAGGRWRFASSTLRRRLFSKHSGDDQDHEQTTKMHAVIICGSGARCTSPLFDDQWCDAVVH